METIRNCFDFKRTTQLTPALDPIDKNQNDIIDVGTETCEACELRRSTRNWRAQYR